VCGFSGGFGLIMFCLFYFEIEDEVSFQKFFVGLWVLSLRIDVWCSSVPRRKWYLGTPDGWTMLV
jgi:hypothetical protein